LPLKGWVKVSQLFFSTSTLTHIGASFVQVNLYFPEREHEAFGIIRAVVRDSTDLDLGDASQVSSNLCLPSLFPKSDAHCFLQINFPCADFPAMPAWIASHLIA
jgi:hypothetical protein